MTTLVIWTFLVLGCDAVQESFPEEFIFGAATASYQIEGAWNEDEYLGHLTHSNPSIIIDNSNGDVAADSYHNYERDVEIMRELGLNAYRFSISWTRLLPTGFTDQVNSAGVAFYNTYINEMLKHNITPMVTLYHWDLPQNLQDLGGFMNHDFINWFRDYAKTVFELFGDRVKDWVTFNEPLSICYYGYGTDAMAPMLHATGVGVFVCAKHLLLAHATAYHLYNNKFKQSQGGRCGLTNNYSWYEEATNTTADVDAALLMNQAHWGLYSDPVFKSEGGFPKELQDLVAKNSARQGFRKSRMPPLTEEEKNMIRGSADFIGVNMYTGFLASASADRTLYGKSLMFHEIGARSFSSDDWDMGETGMFALQPRCIYKMLMHIKERYNNTEILITENGWPSHVGLNDDEKVTYYRKALTDVLDALEEGANISGYMAWSLIDNFEWRYGFTQRFGLYEVDFSSPVRTRTPRKSAFVYKQIIKTRSIDHSYEPDITQITIDDGH